MSKWSPSPGGLSQSLWSEMLVPQFLPSHEGLSQTRWRVKSFRCLSGRNFPSTFAFNRIRWCMKSLFWHFFPSPGGLSQTRWIKKSCSGTFFHRPEVYIKADGLGKSFFSKFYPSPKGVFHPRWLYRASGFHRPRNSLSVDGAKGRDHVWKVEDFHHGRNYQRVDGV